MDRKANENQEAVKAPVDGKIDGKSVLLQRGDTSLNIRNFAKTGTLHIKKTWENPNDALTEKQVKIRLYQNGISTGQEFLLNEENGWEHTVDNVPLFQDRIPVEYKVEEIEIGKTHYSSEYGDGFLYYEVIYPEISISIQMGNNYSRRMRMSSRMFPRWNWKCRICISILLNEVS